jgi:hypothetical protein
MMTTYRDRREAGLYDADEKTSDKAATKLNREQAERIEEAQKEASATSTEEGTEGTASSR